MLKTYIQKKIGICVLLNDTFLNTITFVIYILQIWKILNTNLYKRTYWYNWVNSSYKLYFIYIY